MSESSSNTASSTRAQADERKPTADELLDGHLRWRAQQRAEADKPCWACERYGDWEHDWMDCPACVAQYERWLDEDRP